MEYKLYSLLLLVLTVFSQYQSLLGQGREPSSFRITSMDSRDSSSSRFSGRDSGDSFRITDVNGRRPGSSSDRFTDDRDLGSRGSGSRDFGSGSRGSSRVPENVRVEIEVRHFENPKGILATGSPCDTLFKACDTKITGYIDTTQALAAWPGSRKEDGKWDVLFDKGSTNSADINKSFVKDICGGSLNRVNMRVKAVDVDTFSKNDVIEQFDCLFDIRPEDIARSSSEARFDEVRCKPQYRQNEITLTARARAYEVSQAQCRRS